MPKRYSDEEYYANLPKVQVGSAVLFFNDAQELLIVKPDYKEPWLVPGGSCEVGESPHTCALREIKEEIGLIREKFLLLGIHYSRGEGIRPDSLKFIFLGGTLSSEEINSITLQTEELGEYKFVAPDAALALLSPSLKASIPAALNAMKSETVSYTES